MLLWPMVLVEQFSDDFSFDRWAIYTYKIISAQLT